MRRLIENACACFVILALEVVLLARNRVISSVGRLNSLHRLLKIREAVK
jgi:hypothetical protein